MELKLGNIAFDCDDVLKVATFWSTVLGRPLDHGSSELWGSIGGADPERLQPAWYCNKVPDAKTCKNRVHLDLASKSDEHQATLVTRLEELGAHRLDIGQGNVPWTVLTDPAGNELCVLTPR